MLSSNNINIASRTPLQSPGEIRTALPLDTMAVDKVLQSRQAICDILDGKDDRFLLIVGPCSIHDPDAALEYARKLKSLSDEVADRIFTVMRVYYEKPRTTVGWKGLINDPDMNGTYNIEKGIYIARKLLLEIVDIGLPAGTEMLDPILSQYIADAVSWAAIGARTTEAQTHRQLGSGLSMPVGFKNATDGVFQSAIDAILAAKSEHSFIGVMENGQVGVFHTKGNPYCHVVLRGGGAHPNYGAEYVAFLKVALRKAGLPERLIVDCSHANSRKDYHRQVPVLQEVVAQIVDGETAIKGAMLESNLFCGNQPICSDRPLQYGVSITDACISFEETERAVRETYARLKALKK